MTRYHAESNINIFLTRNLPIDSIARKWSHSLRIPLHYLWAKSSNTTRGQFVYDVTWFYFCFDFVRSHAWCGCCFIVCWRGWTGFVLIWTSRSMGWKHFWRRWTGGGGSCKLDNFHGRHIIIIAIIVRGRLLRPLQSQQKQKQSIGGIPQKNFFEKISKTEKSPPVESFLLVWILRKF